MGYRASVMRRPSSAAALPKLPRAHSANRLSEPVLAREALRILSTDPGDSTGAASILAEAHLARRSSAVVLSQAASRRPRSAPLRGPVCGAPADRLAASGAAATAGH